MDCPKCGVYNPEDREHCWRCGAELPKQEARPRRDPQAKARVWLYIAIAVFLIASAMRMCGMRVPGMSSNDQPTNQAPLRPAMVWVGGDRLSL